MSQFRSLATPEIWRRAARSRRPSDVSSAASCDHRASADASRGRRPASRSAAAASRGSGVPQRSGSSGVDGAVLRHRTRSCSGSFAPTGAAVDVDRRSPADRQSRRRSAPRIRLPEPLLAPPAERAWDMLWSSEDPAYGGTGTPPLDTERELAHSRASAVVLAGPVADVMSHAPITSCLLDRFRATDADPDAARLANGWSPTAWAAMPPARSSGIVTRRYHGLLIAALPAPLGRMVMLSHLHAQHPAARDGAAGRCSIREWPTAARLRRRGARSLVEFRLEVGLAGLALRGRRLRDRETRADAASPEHRPRDVSAARRRRRRSGSSCGRSCTSVTTRAPCQRRCCRTLRAHGGRATASRSAPSPQLPPLRLLLHGRELGAHARRRAASRTCYYRGGTAAATSTTATLWSPGYFQLDLGRRDSRRGTLVASTESWETVRALTPDAALDDRARSRASAAARAGPSGVRDGPAGGAGPRGRSVHHHARRPHRGCHPRQRRRRRSAHGDRRLSLVHRLGPRHDDQPRRADARRPAGTSEAGYILRTFAHYVRDGLIPNMFPGRRTRGPVSHGRRDALVLPCGRSLSSKPTGDRETLRMLLPTLRDIIDHHCAARGSALASIRPTDCCARAPRAIS